MNRTARYLITISVVVLIVQTATGQRHERKAKEAADSAAPQNIAGGITFQSPVPIDKTFEVVTNELKREGHTLDRADKDAGQIITTMEISGGYSQTGTRIVVTLIKDSDSQTSLRVVVTKQKRKKLLQTEPWGGAKADNEESQKVAGALKAVLKE